MARNKIPEATIRRLPAYLRALESVSDQRLTSRDLGRLTGFSSEQVRKDLAYFGAFGTRGVGYPALELQAEIRRILGLDAQVRAALVGAGNLGTALARYTAETHKDVVIAAIFDVDPRKIGTVIANLTVLPLDKLEPEVRRQDVAIGILAVPASAAQAVANRLTAAGVRGLLNFAPTALRVDEKVTVQNIDLTLEMQALAYFVRAEATAEL
jgi:redox-sensing transcriptional repressor